MTEDSSKECVNRHSQPLKSHLGTMKGTSATEDYAKATTRVRTTASNLCKAIKTMKGTSETHDCEGATTRV